MQNNYYFYFKHFDPLNGTLPEPHAVLFVELFHRARKILAPFKSADISTAIQSLNHIPKDPGFIDPRKEEMHNTPIPTPMHGQMFEIIPTSNDIEAIYKNINNVDIRQHVALPHFQWEHVFAAWTLYYGERVLKEQLSLESWPEVFAAAKPTPERVAQYVQDYLLEATQALTFAELLAQQPELQRQFLSARNKQAAKQRTANSSAPLQALVISLYEQKHQHRSNRDAAVRIYDELISEERITLDPNTNRLTFNGITALQTDDPCQRFAVWIGKHNKKD